MPCKAGKANYGCTDAIRSVRGDRDARVLRAGGSQPLVHSRLRRRLRARLSVRISARRLAVRAGRGGLGGRRAAALERQAAMNSAFLVRQALNPCNALYWCALRRWMKRVSTRD